MALLQGDEASPVHARRAEGRSDFVIICDHAGRSIPRALGTLGVSDEALGTHIAWDLGAAAVAEQLADRLDAELIVQRYSRLVIDCNRPLDAPDSIVVQSGGVPIPGNQGLSRAAVEERARAIFVPYHDRIRSRLEERRQRGRRSILIAMHSFTPALLGDVRPWHAGVLYLHDARLARPMLAGLRAEPGLCVGDNQPYAASEATDHSIVEHGERRDLVHVELEVRQDLIDDETGQRAWAERLAGHLQRGAAAIFG
jgi:predicted N-formylglutamate amidohydrolase